MRNFDFTINGSSFNDASTHFDMVINMQINQAKEWNEPYMWTVTFIKSNSMHSRVNNTPLKINIPILPEYEGLTQKEAVDAILCYIRKQIKEKCDEINEHHYNPINAKINADTIAFFDKLDISKGLDITNEQKNTCEYFLKFAKPYLDASKKYIETCKLKRRPVEYGDVYFEGTDSKVNLSNYTMKWSEYDDTSTHFDIVVSDKIKQASSNKMPIILVINFIKTNTPKSTASNTPLQIVVPILPISQELDQARAKEVMRDEETAIMFYIRSEIEKKCKELLADKNPATQKESKRVIEMLKKLDICKGIDLYNSEQMIADANKQLENQSQPNE